MEEYLGGKVRDARVSHRWTQRELATKVFSSNSVISAIELGDEVPSRDLARKLGQVLDLGDDLVNLVKLLEVQQVKDYAREFLRKQLEATVMHEFSTNVPGLLQTEDYARLSMRAGVVADVEGAVRARMERQARIWGRDDPPRMWAVLDEAALYRQMGAPDVARGQLAHLLAVQEQPHVTVQVLPNSAPGITGYLSLLTMPDGQRLAYSEGYATGQATAEPGELAVRQEVYDRLRSSALPAGASTVLIKEAMERNG
ncbi:helix-turn-helix domain-containing protein [Streptomyces daliensis]